MNKIFISFLVTVCSFGFYLWLETAVTASNKSETVSNKLVTMLSNENDDTLAEIEIISLEAEKYQSNLKKLDTKVKQNYNEIANWQRDHFGYFLTDVRESDYSSYDIDSLELMAEQFNIKALDVLAWKYLDAGNRKMSIDASQRAAVLGSTPALMTLGNQLAHFHNRPDWDEEDSRLRIMTQLSYMQAALIRGDKKMVRFTAMTLAPHKDLLNDEDIRNIQVEGRNIYNQLEVERAKLGLSPFDNSIPWYVDEHNARLNQRVTDDAGIESPLFFLTTSD